MTAVGFALLVVIFYVVVAVMVAVEVGRFCVTNSRVEAAQDAAREAALQQIVEAGR